MSLIKRYPRNTVGRDFAVGDIHGHFSRLRATLAYHGFNPATDRLFAVGDLIDRGPECMQALDWLDLPWFHSVRGNHDDYVVRFDTCDIGNWMFNGGTWFAGLAWDIQREFAIQFADLPLAIEVETDAGLIGIVHADSPVLDWRDLLAALDSRDHRNFCMWSRKRVDSEDTRKVANIRAVVCGHTPLRHPALLGNVYHIDTGGWLPHKGGFFTLLDLQTLECFPPVQRVLEWERL